MTSCILLAPATLAQHARQRHRLVLDVALLLEGGIDGDEVVGAADLDAVAGEVDHRPVGAGGQVAELLERLAEPGQVGVEQLAHLGEADAGAATAASALASLAGLRSAGTRL